METRIANLLVKHVCLLVAFTCWFTLSHAATARRHLQGTFAVTALFSDHMVLQQQSVITGWGKALPGHRVVIHASWGKSADIKADDRGEWAGKLVTPKAGGPYNIRISCDDTSVLIQDVMIGEVWLASGQSNMDIPLSGWPPNDTIAHASEEIAVAQFPDIRFMKIPFNVSAVPVDSINGKWVPVTSKTAAGCSATAYFFARSLYQRLHVPIGIIQSSIGGTPAEAWTSRGGLKSLKDFTDAVRLLDPLQAACDDWRRQWGSLLKPTDSSQWKEIDFSDGEASASAFNDNQWSAVNLPGKYDQLGTAEIDGAVWLRKHFEINDTAADYVLHIGAVDDMDATYINGQYVGGMAGYGHASVPRTIHVSRNLLHKGSNVIAIRAIDVGGEGIVKGAIFLASSSGDSIALEGSWKRRVVAELVNNKFLVYGLDGNVSGRPDIAKLNSNTPTVLFNAMIHPVIHYKIRGVIWYQGESNVGRAVQYKKLFPLLIKDWRAKWGYAFPFYYVQIAPFLYSAADQKGQAASLRNAQRYAMKLPRTGMVSTLDIGYLKTAHPPNKEAVGRRLANLALVMNYGKAGVAMGPLYKHCTAVGKKMIVQFSSTGTGLVASKHGLYNFELAGLDKVFVSARAYILNNKVIVTAPSVSIPAFVRYAWTDSSNATLFNKEGLPAATFSSER